VDNELHILQHSLGIDQYGRGERYRNHFVTGEGSTDYPACMSLVAKGLMMRRDGSPLTGGDYLFRVTEAGQEFVTENSPAPPPEPKLTRSQKRYRRYLEADCGVSFREWLKYECTYA
jgi:hypothetical protein